MARDSYYGTVTSVEPDGVSALQADLLVALRQADAVDSDRAKTLHGLAEDGRLRAARPAGGVKGQPTSKGAAAARRYAASARGLHTRGLCEKVGTLINPSGHDTAKYWLTEPGAQLAAQLTQDA